MAIVLFGIVSFFALNSLERTDHAIAGAHTEAAPDGPQAAPSLKATADAEDPLVNSPGSQVLVLGKPKFLFKSALLSPKSKPYGEPLRLANQNPDQDKGRVVKLQASELRGWSALREGDTILLPGIDEQTLEATVNLTKTDGEWFRMGGELADGKGTFSLSTNYSEVAGMILMPEVGVGFQITMDAGEPLMVERRLSSLVCFPLNKQAEPSLTARDRAAVAIPTMTQTIPVINTRPGAQGVMFIDFDGETVIDPFWNGGRAINAAPSPMTSDQIAQIISLVSQDWAPFDVTITTDISVYAAASPGRRMHVVVTPTDTAAPGSGGVAYINSWSLAGRVITPDIVCWVFNPSIKSIAEAISHELGHTVGLNHDGVTGVAAYYSGHGGNLDVPTSWGPIMGASYSRSLVQWSKGEYAGANNSEDDLAIIGRAANQFGLIQNELPNGTKPLPLPGSGAIFETVGLLRSPSSVDTYFFNTTGGEFWAHAGPTDFESNVDVQMELQRDSGETLLLSDVPDTLNAGVRKILDAGNYRLIVRPSGTGTAPVGGYITGYSSYGSVGRYKLWSSIQGGNSLPTFGATTGLYGSVGTPFTYTVNVSSADTVLLKSSFLPAGLSFNPATLVISGTPTQETTPSAPGRITLVAVNASGSTTSTISIFISKALSPLSDAFLGKPTNSPSSLPWTGVSMAKDDGFVGTVAQSGAIGNGASSSVSFNFAYQPTSRTLSPLWSVMTFYWKASSEPYQNTSAGGDAVRCLVDGIPRKDLETGSDLLLSGETGWVKQTVRIQGAGQHKVEFVYTKDASLSAGQDRVWVYLSSIDQPPVFTKSPSSTTLTQGATSFTLSAEVSGATDLVWRRESVTLSDGASESGSRISGARSSTLTVSNISGADAGTYWMEARNAFGAVSSKSARVLINAPPVITQQPMVPPDLRVGQSMTLSATVFGGKPLYFRWEKDGAISRWKAASSSTISLVVSRTTPASAGKYVLSVMNEFGSAKSLPVTVNFSGAGTSTSRPH